MRSQLFVLVPLVSFAVSAGATAGTIIVPSGQPTIQLAVDNANPGDTILVKSGTYKENVSIPPLQTNLKLKTSGKVILDARPNRTTGTGPGFTVGADGTSITGFIVRHARGPTATGIGISIAANGVSINKCTILHSNNEGIKAAGNGITVSSCVLRGNDGGLSITGANAVVRKVRIEQDGEYGIHITGADATVTKCRFRAIEDNEAILVTGANANVSKCVAQNVDGEGVSVDGDNPTIVNNRLIDIADDNNGISVKNTSTGLIAKNFIQFSLEDGIALDSSANGLVVRDNVLDSCGAEDEHGIVVDGSSNTILNNVIRNSQEDGVHVAGSGNIVRGNKITGSGEDGIDIEGNGTTVENNVITGNQAEGIENNAPNGIEIRHNTVKKNRIDIANDGTIATFTGNSFGTGGTATPPEIDD